MNDITIYRNITYPFKYIHTDTEGNPVSLAGATLYFTVKEDEWDADNTDETALIKKTVTMHTDPDQGVSEFFIDDTDTNIAPGKYYYDVIIEFNGKSQPPSIHGRFTVVGTPTNRNVQNG